MSSAAGHGAGAIRAARRNDVVRSTVSVRAVTLQGPAEEPVNG